MLSFLFADDAKVERPVCTRESNCILRLPVVSYGRLRPSSRSISFVEGSRIAPFYTRTTGKAVGIMHSIQVSTKKERASWDRQYDPMRHQTGYRQ